MGKMKEEDIRPKKIFDKHLKLAKEGIKRFFSEKDDFEWMNCPACVIDKADFQFDKDGFKYVLCKNCQTLYVNPRPKIDNIQRYYKYSKQTKYWAEHFYRDTEAQRREKIYKPRARMVRDFIRKNVGEKVEVFADIGAGYGTFCEEVKGLNVADEIIAIEPSDDLARNCEKKGFKVVQLELEETGEVLNNKVSFATSFELIEHLHSPQKFLMSARNILTRQGYLLLTTLNINGFDLQVLWEKSNSISPPHHLNFFNLESLEYLLKKCGFKVVEKSTPGFLDVDIVKNADKDGDIELGKFIRHLIENMDEKVPEDFQLFLQRNNLSSHMCIVAQKV